MAKPFIVYFSENDPNVLSVEHTKKEKLKMYDIIMQAFLFKYTYESMRLKGQNVKNSPYNLNDLKVYNNFLAEIDKSIHDPLMRAYILETIKVIKNNDLRKKSVQISYQTIYTWFHPNNLKGKTFRDNLEYLNGTIDFKTVFEMCNSETITENSPCFAEVKSAYAQFKREYDDLIL
ncbi:MAG: hypothetical protein E7378_01790 [Clostridiales bacterium]|nr:hypothetical protein [Clostridiales bacterium]